MALRRDAVRNDAEIEALLREPLVSWPQASPVAVREVAESTPGVEATILTVAVAGAGLGRSDLADQVVDALSEALIGTYPAWLPEAEHLAGPGGAGLAALRAMCERAAAGRDLFGPFLIAAAEAALCGHPLAAAEFARETAVRQARKLILRAYGHERLVVMVELTGTWSDAQVEVAEANALWLAGPGELGVWLFGSPTAGMTRVPRSSLHDRMATSDSPAAPRAPYLTPLRGPTRSAGQSSASSRISRDLRGQRVAPGTRHGRRGLLANPIRVDLVWRQEQCVVELDGPDHLDTDKYAADRARDRALQRAGFSVLRYTNDEVLGDVARVLGELERFLRDRRR